MAILGAEEYESMAANEQYSDEVRVALSNLAVAAAISEAVNRLRGPDEPATAATGLAVAAAIRGLADAVGRGASDIVAAITGAIEQAGETRRRPWNEYR